MPGEGCRPKVRLHKFEDLDRDGEHDPGEPMLSGVQFDFVELGSEGEEQVHQRTTDASGVASIDFHGPTRLRIRELLRQSGGMWGITTPHQRAGQHWYILPQLEEQAPRSGPVFELGPVHGPANVDGDPVENEDCDDVDLWVGNARSFLPKTGAGGLGTPSAQQVGSELHFD